MPVAISEYAVGHTPEGIRSMDPSGQLGIVYAPVT